MPDEFWCRYNLFDEYTASATGPVLFTIAIIALTCALEVTAHKNFKGAADVPYATLYTRATRLAIACLVYPLLLAAFVLRITNAHDYDRRTSLCRTWIAGAYWPAIWILNVIPLACASCASLRTLVDCVLARWGTGLGNRLSRTRGEGTIWVPLLPIFGVVMLVFGLFEGLKVPIKALMGREIEWSGERGEEEGMGLVENVEGGGDRDEGEGGDTSDMDGLPAYEEAVGSKGCAATVDREGMGKGDAMV